MMRARASQLAPRLPVSRFRAGCRNCADPFRRAVPTLALAFLASLLALGFRGSNFSQLSLSIALGPANPPAAGAGDPTAPHRDAPRGQSASLSRYEVLPQRRFQNEQTWLMLAEQAEEVGRGGDDETTAQAGGGSDAAEPGSSVKAQDVKDRGPRVRGIEISSDPGTDGTYAAEDEIRVTVTFTRAVEVSWSPELGLRVGSEVKRALYQSGAGSSELVFTYQVAEGDEDTDGVSVEAGSLLLDEATIRDPAGNTARPDHEGLEADPRHLVDGVRPVLLAEEAELDGDQLILPFAETLDGASTPPADDFRVTVAGQGREVLEIAVEGSEVRLTLVSPTEAGEAAAVSYAVAKEPSGKPLRDEAGNPAEGFTDQAVVNRTGGALPARAVRQIQAILEAKKRRTPAQRKVDSQLLEEWQKVQGRPGADRTVTVDLRAEVTPEVLQRIRDLGGTVLSSFERYRAIRAEIPLSQVETLAAHEAVRSIRTADKAATRKRPRKLSPDILIDVLEAGSRTTQGDVAHRADTARTTHGVDGTGIGIGVLSNGVGSLAARQATGDLPARVTVLSGQEGEGDEGTAMLEIVHDLAPGAELYFATAFGGQARFAANIEALCEAGADVIVDDVYYFSEGPFQDDIIARGVNAAVADGCFYFSAGGNAGNKNDGTAGVWEGDFAAGSPLVLNGVTVGTQHDFGGGVTQNRITEDSDYGYVLWWADPLEGSANDYDLFMLDENANVLRSSTRIQDGTRDPYEYISSGEDDHTDARLVIVQVSGAADRYLRLDTLEGQLAVSTAGSLFGHSAAESAIAVAAVAVQSAGGTGGVFDGTESVRTSNSDGPRRIFFEPDGTSITAGNFSSTGGKLLRKPDLAAATCVRTTTPGFSIFCGVSSAAPHAAAIGALVLEGAEGPNSLTQAQLLTAMTGASLDIEATGVDRDSGAGIVMAPGAVDAVDVAVADRNQAPTVEDGLDDQTFALGAAAVTLDLADTFGDPDNNTLTYSALSSNIDRASLSRTGSMLTLTPGAPGTATVTVHATDPDGLSAVDSFSVSVTLGTRDYDRDDDDLIEVSSLAQLDAIRYDSNGNGIVDDSSDWPSYFAAFTQATGNMGCSSSCEGYELTADLDFDTDSSGGSNDGDTYWNDGDGWEPIGDDPYQAVFEGNGRTIANLFIDRSTESDVGLFSEVGEFGLIRNLGLEAVDVTGRDYVGGLVGDGDKGLVDQSHVTGQVSGEDVVGGLAGSLGRVFSSTAAVEVSGTGDGIGGLAGAANIIVVSYATGGVTGGGMHLAAAADCEDVGGVGGLVGNVCGAVAASYATGPVSGTAAVGGLAGTGSARFLSSFWDIETSGVRVGFGADDGNDNGLIDASESPVLGLAGHATSELQSPTGYSGIYQHWNRDLDGDGKGDDPWHFGTATQYPALSADLDGGGTATWQEHGYQLRSGPTLTVSSTSGQAQVSLSWTAVAVNHWSPAPGLSYTLYRDDGTTVEPVATAPMTRSHTDTGVTLNSSYTYQVAAVVAGGETVRSSWVSVVAGASNQPPVPVGVLADLTLRVGGGTGTVTVSGAFRDPESDTLTYGASSSSTTVATVSTSGAEVTITPVAAGRATITVTATDASGSNTAATQRFTVTVWASTAVDYDSDDDGLIEISSLAQLDAVRHDRGGDGNPTADGKTAYEAAFSQAVEWMGCNAHQGCSGYELTADLDFDTNGNGTADAGDPYWNNGEGWVPIGGEGTVSSGSLLGLSNPFLAVFEGNGHTISHLFIDTDTAVLSGLFGYTFLSNIRNLGLIDVEVDVGSTGLAAGLVAFNFGEIRTSYVTGQVSGTDNVGGLVGINHSIGVVRGCYATSRVAGEDDVGGLVADNRGILAASYATGQVSGVTEAGGLVGFNQPDGEIQASYATGPVSGASNAGGLVGSNEGTLTDSYWDTRTSGHTTGSEGRTTAQLQFPTGYSGIYRNWNLDLDGDGANDSPWHFGTSSQYPVLSVDVDGSDGASWQEFGYQLREGPSLTATPETTGVALTWTAVVTSHWDPAPGVAYTLYREDGTTVETLAENLSGLSHTDSDVMEGETYTYQVAAVVTDGEAARSARVSLTVPDNTPPTVISVAITSDPGTDGIYAADDEIGVTVTFSEPVVVRRTPRLTLEVGGEDRTAEYETGTGTAALLFVYKVAEDDEDIVGVSIGADSLSLGSGTIRDRAGNPAALTHGAVGTLTGHRVDGVKPELDATDGAVVNGTTLTLTYDEPLDGTSPPPASAFTVTGGGAGRTVSGVAVGGRLAILTLDPAVEHGETGLRVSYRIPTGAGEVPLRDVVGNQADRLSNLPVTNETPDTTPPAVSKIEISSDPGTDRTYAAEDDIQVTVTFSETVEVTGTPRLQIELGGGSRTAAYEGGSGTAALVFEYEVAEGESDTDGVGVEADSLTGGTIRDEARNNAELDHDGVAADAGHQVDGVRPRLAASGGAVVNGTTLRLTYDEALDIGSAPGAGDFTVSGGDRARTVSRVVVRGAAVELTLNAGAEHGEAGIQVSYTPGMKRLRDVPGNEAVGLSREPVTNETPDTTPPRVESLGIASNPGSDQTYAMGDGIEVRVTFSETVEVEGTPRLRLRVGNRTRTAGYLRDTGTAAPVFGYEVADGDEDTGGVSVNAGRIALNGGTIEDEAENAAELAHEAVAPQAGHRVDGVRPAFVSAAVDGASLTLTYGEALDGGSRPASGDFTVEVGGSGRSVSGVSVSGSGVTLTLNPAVEHGDTGIRVSYTVPTGVGANPIQDEVGNDARGLSSRSVTNTTGAPNTAPEITSPSSFDVPENQSVARRLAARDTDAGDEVTGWEIVGGADRSEFSIASDTGELSFRDAPDYEAPGDNEYLVTVEVTSGAGARELEAEQMFTIRVTDEREPPEVPEAPAISGETAEGLEVSWSEPENTGPEITDYDAQYREKGRGRFTGALHDGPGRTVTLSDLNAGTVYEVQVRATNDEGTGGWSDPGEGMTVAPLTLEMMTMEEPPVSGPFRVRFSFSEPVTGFSASDIETGQDPACVDDQNNTVFCDPGIGGVQTADDRVFTTTVTPWTDRVAHSYTLRLTVAGGAVRSSVGSKPNEEPEEPLEVRVAPPGVTEPISSIGLRASSGSGSVRLNWNRPSEDGGSPIIRYEVRFAPAGEAWSDWENVGAGARGVTVGNLVNGREYVFEVRAVNALGKGGAETAGATPELRIAPPPPRGGGGGGGGGGLLFPPEAPLGLMAMPGDGAVRLEWSPPDSDGGTPILRYEYRLKEGRGEFGEWTPIADSAPGEVNASVYTVGELGNGTVYAFELRAVNLVGKGRVSEAVEVVMGLDRAYWSNFLAGDLQGSEASLERGPFGNSPQRLRLRFGAGLRFEEDELDGEGEVTGTRLGSYGYRYTSRTTGELRLDYDGGESCQLRMTFGGVGAGSYSYRCGGVLGGQGSFRMSGLNRGPEITSLGPFELAENRTMVGRLEAVDGDDEIERYGIAGGADGGLFAVEAETGELRFREAPDYEDPSDVESAEPQSGAADNEYIVVVEVSSGEGERERKGSRAIRVRVSDEEEPPEITSVGPFEVVENRTRVGQLEAMDQDKQDEITGYGIAGGADGALFAVEATGELMFREAPDYENPSDVENAQPASGAADNEYIVVVEVRSGEGERERKGSRAIRVRVADEEEPPEITGAGVFEVVENRTRVGQLEAVDQDKQDEITEYGIAGGADGGLFAVEAETGELMFRQAPDYEDPSDVESEEPQSAAGDNEYIVVVEVRSGEGERERKGSRAIRVRVSDEEEPPEITSLGPFEVVENQTRVGQLEAVDQDKQDEITEYGIAGGADGGLFEVEAETGELRFREAPDYEDPSDVESAEPASGAGDNEYIVVVEVRSGEGERERRGSRAIRVRVSDEEEPPGAPAAPVVTAEGSDSLKVSWREPENRGPEIVDYEVRYREGGEAGYSDGGHEGTGLEVRLSGLKEGTAYEVQVRAVNEEGMSEWSEPGEGRTDREEADPEEPDPDDPSDFTEGDLEGRRLRLRLEGEEGSATVIELRFGEGNRFEQIESVGEQAATRAEGAARPGSYTYQRTGPHMGTLSLAYDDGSSCEVLLAFTESGAGTFSYDCGEGDPAEGSFRLTTGSLFVPVILSAAGRSNSFFTSELTLTNRGDEEVKLDYTYRAHRGGGSGKTSDVLAPGMQKIETDALTYLRGLGVPIPETGNRIGTLRVEARLGSEVEAVVRTTTEVPEGRAGLAYLGVAEEEGFEEAVYLCGLRQNSRDRSNLAFQNMGAEEEEAITLRTTVYSGGAADTNARVLEDVTLEPGEFHQYSGLLGVLGVPAQGYVRVERVEGTSPFYAYGVINDQANSDGSFVFPLIASSLAESTGQTLPVIVETSAFTSELTVTNFSEEPRKLDFQFVAEGIETDDKTAAFSMTLGAGQQHILADVVDELRRQGVAGLGSGSRALAGAVFATAVEGDMSGIVIGARTGSQGGGGQYSVFYNAVPFGEAFTEVAWVEGLQQNQENRSNLALVNTGEVDGSPSVFHLEIYDGETGLLAETVVTKPIPARGWHQIDGILGSYAPETRQGYIRIEKVSGANPFLAYGVVNDGGAPGERSGDGAYLPARK